ncbi:MAG: NifB/NifX family molybdenum-iron cluster-binding protein [Desulfomonilaceae bacterium]
MKIAITSSGKSMDSPMDPRFGRAPYIIIADDAGELLEVIDNAANVNAMRGAGIQAAKSLADRGVSVLLTGHCGPNAFTALQSAGIKVGSDQSGLVRDALEKYKSGGVNFANGPNAEAHW